MSLELPNSVKILSDEPLDAKYLNGKIPYTDITQVNSLVPIGIRTPYLTVNIAGVEYWWVGGAWVLKLPTITGTRIIDAYIFGFSPSATGETNSIAINNALSLGGKIIVSIPGVYEIDDSIVLPSNTTIEFVKGCTLKHVIPSHSNFVNTFKNKGCETSTGNDNISIIGNGLKIDFNGHDGTEGGATLPFAYQNGRISFFKVTNFEVSGIYVNDLEEGYTMYFFELTNCAFGKINDINLKNYSKDGIDLIHSHDIHIKNYRSTTGDDAIFMGSGWINYDKTIGDTYNITIENWIGDSVFVGVPSRIITTSWDDWQTGRTYMGSEEDASELCVNAGRVYRKVTNGNQVASNAPTHSTGIVTGIDGIGWLVVSDTVKYTNDVYNIRYINCRVVNTYSQFLWAYESPTFSQNANTAILDDVFFEDCNFQSDSGVVTVAYSAFVLASCNIGRMVFNNCRVGFKENISNLGYNTFITVLQNSMNNKIFVDKINIDNLEFKGEYNAGFFIKTTGGFVEVNTVNVSNSDIELSNAIDGEFISISNQTCVKTVNITGSKIKNILKLLLFDGTNWFDAPIERVVNTINTIFTNCAEIYTHQYSYPNEMVIYYNAFGCQFIDTQSWIINNVQSNAPTMVVNFSGNKTNTPSKVIQNSSNVTKKMLDLPAGTYWVNNTSI